jgi:LysM repeat protein
MGRSHQVAQGDTMYTIAAKFGVRDWQAIATRWRMTGA